MALLQSGDTPFEKLLYDLMASDKPPMVGAVGENHVELVFPSGRRASLFRWVADDATLVTRLRARMKAGDSEVALIGGPAEARKLLKKATPFFTNTAILTYHLPDVGPLWRSKKPLIAPPLGAKLALGVVGAPDAETWRAVVQKAAAHHAELHQESTQFVDIIRARTPIATYVLIAACLLMFALESALGGSESTPVLTRLGALVPTLWRAEPWRLFSSAFLHIGPFHVLINCYVLFIIGSFLERVIGTWRFLAIFWLSVLGGSVASLVWSPAGLTAGASGGALGLLAAQSVLAFRSHGLLPQVLIPGARRAALTNLALNVFNSLRPGVSMSAHLGGAVVGAVLIVSSFFVRGLPKLGGETSEPTSRIDPVWLRVIGVIGIVAMVGSVVAAVALGGGLRLMSPPELVRVPIGKTSVSVKLPTDVQPCKAVDQATPTGTLTRLTCGDVLRDPIVYVVAANDFQQPLAASTMAAEIAGLKKAIEQSEEAFPTADRQATKEEHGHQVFLASFAQVNGGRLRKDVATYMTDRRVVVVTTVYWTDRPGSDGSAERVLSSVDEP